jgi:type VI secretion system secreted protein VgrG
MTQSATHNGRMLELITPLGPDRLLLRRLRGREAIGEPYCYTLDLMNGGERVEPASLLGEAVSVRFTLPGGATRQLNGMITALSLVESGYHTESGFFHRYRAELRPQLWRLTLHSHCRFFHDQSVPDILRKVLDPHRVAVDNRCSRHYPKLEHCAQYNETDYAFCRRLMEREGIYFFFRHGNNKEVLLLADAPAAHKELEHAQTLAFDPHGESGTINTWLASHSMVSGEYALNAYDFKKVTHSLNQGLLTRARGRKPERGVRQIDLDNYHEQDTGRHYAQTRLEAAGAREREIEADSNALGIVSGGCFSMQGHPDHEQNRRYLVTAVEYSLDNQAYSSSAEPESGAPLCHLRAIPADQPFRLPLETPIPHAVGPQTAVVVGDADGDIHTDEYGRIQVQFNWEQFAPPAAGERTRRCWVRLAQGWAGKGWGSFFLPRAGHEVVVEFINGDIDRPLVTGCVYNVANPPPYRLPRRGDVSTVRSRSTSGQGFNELRFIDTAGQEQLFLHAEKDFKRYVKHDELGWIGRDRHQVTEGESRTRTDKDSHIVVGGRLHQRIDKDRHLSIGGEARTDTGGDYSLDVKGARRERVGGKLSLQVASAIEIRTDGALVEHGANIALSGDTEIVLQAPRICLKAGASFITLGPEGVSISGALVRLNSGGSASSAQRAAPTAPAAPDAPQAPLPTKQDNGSKEVE